MKKQRLSVIIPVGPGRKLEAVESLKNQDEPVEIIIEKGTNPSKNRNNGAVKAKTEFIAFVDGHSILPRDWSRNIIQFFRENPNISVVGGPQLTPRDESYFGKVSGYALSSIFGAAEVSTRYKIKETIFDANEKFLTSANLACRKEVFKKIKFNEDIYPGEDPQFIADSKKEGFKAAYSPKIIAFHRRRENTKELAQQIFNYGKTRPIRQNPIELLGKPSFLVPSIFLVYLSIFTILSLIHPVFILPIIAYLIVNPLFSILESIKNKDILSLAYLPFIFFTIHVSYGLGFIYSLISR